MLSPAIATALINQGIDCEAVAGRPDLRSLGDSDVMQAALEEGRILVTNNVGDFERLRLRREENGAAVPGLTYTSDDTFPRTRAFSGRLSAALEVAARRQLVVVYGGVLWLTPIEKQ
jgi:Domain of unknown function (DUF5615)